MSLNEDLWGSLGKPPPATDEDLWKALNKPKVPKGYAAPKPKATQVGAIVGVLGGVAGKPTSAYVGAEIGKKRPTQIAAYDPSEHGKLGNQAEIDAKMEAEIIGKMSNEDLGRFIEDTYKGSKVYGTAGNAISGNVLQIREKLLTERQRRLGQAGNYALPPVIRQAAAYGANLPELMRSSASTVGHPEASVGDTIAGASDIVPLPFAEEIIKGAMFVAGKASKPVATMIRNALKSGNEKQLEAAIQKAKQEGVDLSFRPKTEVPPPKTPEAPKPAPTKPVAPKTAKPQAEPPASQPEPEVTGPTPEPRGLSRASRALLADVYGTNKPVTIHGKTHEQLYADGKKLIDEGWDAETEMADLAKSGRPASDEQIGAFAAYRDDLLDDLAKLNKQLESDLDPDRFIIKTKERDDLFEKIAGFDRNLDEVKGSAGRGLSALKIGQTVNWADLDEALLEARRIKGSALTTSDIASVKKVHGDLEKRLSDVEAENLRLQEAKATEGVARVFQDAARRSGKRTVDAVRAEKSAAKDRVRELFVKSLHGGAQSGGLQTLFETVPELAREVRKVIELSIEEFKLNKLDGKFYETIRKELDDLGLKDPETGEKIDITDSDIRATFAKHYEETSRTTSEATKNLNELRKQSDLFEKIELLKAGEELPKGKAVPKPSEEVANLRKQLNALLKTIGAAPSDNATRTKLKGILAEAEDMLNVGYRNLKKKQPPTPADIQALKNQIAKVRKEMRLEDQIATLENQLESGVFKGKAKHVTITNERIAKLQEQADSARRRVQAAVRARQPVAVIKKLEGVGRSMQLLNHVARVVDLTANTVKLGTYIATNPARSLISELGFGRTAGREKLLSPVKLYLAGKGGLKRALGEIGDVWKGADLETLEKYGKSGGIGSKLAGITDVVFKDFYNRVALDDFAVGFAKESKAAGSAFKEYRLKAFKQLTEGAEGPLSHSQVQAAKLGAHDWALRQTFNIDNLLSKTGEGAKIIPSQFLVKQGHGNAAKGWEALVDANSRFTKVIGNVALERLNYHAGLGAVEAMLRAIAGKSSGMVGKAGFRAKTMGLVKGQIASKEARLITDLATKGLTGLAMFEASKHIGGFFDQMERDKILVGKIQQTESGRRFIEWRFMPELHGGIDAQQLGGLISPMLMGRTQQMIEESKLTDDQKADLWRKYQLNETTSTPMASNVRDLILAAEGERDIGKVAGSIVSRNVIPGGVREEAERLDEERTGVRLRKSRGFWDEFLKRIPGYRETLPPNVKK